MGLTEAEAVGKMWSGVKAMIEVGQILFRLQFWIFETPKVAHSDCNQFLFCCFFVPKQDKGNVAGD